MKALLKIVGVLILLVGIFYGYIFYAGWALGPEISERVTDFLILASDGDAEAAYEFFTEDLKKSLSLDDFVDSIQDHFFRLSFEKQNKTGYNFNVGVKKPLYNLFNLRRIYGYQGVVIYSNGEEGDLTMVFVKEGGEWKLIVLDVGDPYKVY